MERWEKGLLIEISNALEIAIKKTKTNSSNLRKRISQWKIKLSSFCCIEWCYRDFRQFYVPDIHHESRKFHHIGLLRKNIVYRHIVFFFQEICYSPELFSSTVSKVSSREESFPSKKSSCCCSSSFSTIEKENWLDNPSNPDSNSLVGWVNNQLTDWPIDFWIYCRWFSYLLTTKLIHKDTNLLWFQHFYPFNDPLKHHDRNLATYPRRSAQQCHKCHIQQRYLSMGNPPVLGLPPLRGLLFKKMGSHDV